MMLTHPLPGARKTDGFGPRGAIAGLPAGMHTGQDYAAAAGTPILAAAAGTISSNGFETGGYGHYVYVNHGDGVITRYAHMRAASPLAKGAKVTAGQVIGYVGATGAATGNHLHFEVRVDGVAKNPLTYLITKPVGQEEEDIMEPIFIAGRKLGTQGSVYQLTTNGRKRLVGSPEWAARRAVESASGVKIPVGIVDDADLAKIPNA